MLAERVGFNAELKNSQRYWANPWLSKTGQTCISKNATNTGPKCFGQAALWKFRLYWSVVGPFSGLIRKAILNQVKSEGEAKARG